MTSKSPDDTLMKTAESTDSIVNLTDSSTQTDEELIYNYAWKKFYHHFNQHVANSTQQVTNASSSQASSNENDMPNSKQYYDCKNGIYFDAKNSLYFDQSTNLYFDRENKIYYTYMMSQQTKTYHLRYHSQISEANWMILSQKLESSQENEAKEEIIWIENDSDNEKEKYVSAEKVNVENTIKQKLSQMNIKKPTATTSDCIQIDSDVEEGEICDVTSKYPPCIRAILMQSSIDFEDELICKNKLGTLFLIPYTGGTIGKNSAKHVIDLINEEDVEIDHASVEYDLKKKTYLIHDKKSKCGTFINGEKLIPMQKYPLNHYDRLDIGSSVSLLIHIHSGSITCVHCEPGEVMEKFKSEQKHQQLSGKMSAEETRREINKSIKKKYGIKQYANETEMNSYNDRSKIRRNKEGIDTSHIETGPSAASAHKPISENNLGFKLLKSMGWKEGTGLGKDGTGIKEPVSAVIRQPSAGLGFEQSSVSLDATEEEKRKIMNWNKTKTRFNLIDKKSQKDLANVFNVDDDDDEIID